MKKIIIGLLLLSFFRIAYADWDSSTDMQTLTVSAAVLQVQNSLKAIDGTSGVAPGSLKMKGNTSGSVTLTPAATAGTTTYTLPAMSGAPMLSTLTTNAAGVADSITGGTNQLIFEGSTGNTIQTFLTVTDPTGSDKTATIPNETGTVQLETAAWTDYGGTSTIVGWSSFTIQKIYYKKVGKTVYVAYSLSGTSNNTGTTFTLPYTSNTSTNSEYRWFSQVSDNGGAFNTGLTSLDANSNTVSVNPDAAGSVWTASGTKTCKGEFWFEASS